MSSIISTSLRRKLHRSTIIPVVPLRQPALPVWSRETTFVSLFSTLGHLLNTEISLHNDTQLFEIDYVQRTKSHSDQFNSQHAEPWKAVRSKAENASSKSATHKLVGRESDQEDQRADRIADDTVGDTRGFITPGDGSDDMSIHCKNGRQRDTHRVTRHCKVSTPCKPKTATVTSEPKQ